MRTVILSSILSSILILGCAVPPAAGPAPGRWDTVPPMLHARSAHSVVADDRGIFALAGSGAGGRTVAAVERFEGARWHVETTLPGDGLNAPASVILGDRLFVIGGFNGVSNVPTDEVLIYDLRTRLWTTGTKLPAPRGGHAAVVLDGRIHVFGGGNSRSTIADHSVFDPATNAWTELAPLRFPRGSPAGVAFEGRIYSIGGRSGPSDFGDVDVFDPATGAWTHEGMIDPIGTASAVVYRGTIHLFGGESQARRESVSTVLRYDPRSRAWTVDTPMPTGRNYARAVVFRDHVYTVGGNAAGPASHSAAGSTLVERFHVPR